MARIARTLALAPDSGPLPSEIRAIHGDIGDTPAVLADYSPFTRIDRWHWTLGTPAEMSAG